jgi:hypothetical protein
MASEKVLTSLEDLLPALSTARTLTLHNPPSALLASVWSLPRIESLHLFDAILSLSEVAEFSASLRSLSFTNCTLIDGTEDWSIPDLEQLTWSSGILASLNYLPRSSMLRYLFIENAESLLSLEGLEWLPDECHVHLIGTPEGLDPAPLISLEQRCYLRYDPMGGSEWDSVGQYIDFAVS